MICHALYAFECPRLGYRIIIYLLGTLGYPHEDKPWKQVCTLLFRFQHYTEECLCFVCVCRSCLLATLHLDLLIYSFFIIILNFLFPYFSSIAPSLSSITFEPSINLVYAHHVGKPPQHQTKCEMRRNFCGRLAKEKKEMRKASEAAKQAKSK